MFGEAITMKIPSALIRLRRTLSPYDGKETFYPWVALKKRIGEKEWLEYKLERGVASEGWKGIDYSARNGWDYNHEEHESVCCSFFGCGKSLSIREQLFGNKCINHQ